MSRWLQLTGPIAVAALTVASGCGPDGDTPVRGEPEAVVRRAPDRTLAAAVARVEGAAPGARSRGEVELDDPSRRLPLTGRRAAQGYPELSYPAAVVDLVRGAVAVESYGGVAVRGVSTFRYEMVVNVERALRSTPPDRRPQVAALAGMLGAPAFYADVWVDEEGRLRRVQLPVEKTTKRPASRDRRTPDLVTIDFFDFRPS
ncbi:MAG TPA: hypothetical protein VHE80_08125 [Acidimicrobiales bacterium]|nr:hypothetical protein [Acidimicrobiales bacterium]